MRLEIPDRKKLVFEMRLRIEWRDMDVLGHVNNAVYFNYFEVLRIEWLAQFRAQPDPKGTGPVIANTFCNFRRQVAYPGELLGRLHAANPGRSSFDTFMTLERADQPGVVCADGGATVVWVDFTLGRSMPLPEPVRQAID